MVPFQLTDILIGVFATARPLFLFFFIRGIVKTTWTVHVFIIGGTVRVGLFALRIFDSVTFQLAFCSLKSKNYYEINRMQRPYNKYTKKGGC